MASKKRRRFVIPRIKEEEKVVEEPTTADTDSEEKKQYRAERFVGSVTGSTAKDEIYFPHISYGNKGTQYDGLRDKRVRSEEESKRIHGHKYYEFSEIIQSSGRHNMPAEDVQSEDEKYFNDDSYENDTNYDQVEDYHTEEYEDYYEEKIVEPEPEVKQTPPRPARRASRPQVDAKTSVAGIEVDSFKASRIGHYSFPPIHLLKKGSGRTASDTDSINQQRRIIDSTLRDFKIGAQVARFTKGPTVTQFEITVDPGVNIGRVRNISQNLQMNLAVRSIRIQAPIPGKAAVGIEVPNQKTDLVLFGDLLDNEEFLRDENPLNVVLGLDLSGAPVYADISAMPHGLIAGATGSGKSVCINSMIISMLYKAHPDDLRLILIDPKVVEFSSFEDIPHLATPIITDPKLANASLRWAVEEMENRYQLFKHFRVRDIKSYNKNVTRNSRGKKLPYIVIIIDELADLMSVASSDVEDYIRRIAQKARAAGIHLIVATQRPSTDIIKGTIKANIPTRIAFMVSSQVDSITILDKAGAEKLLGKGDMLFNDGIQERRVQGAYVSYEEIVNVTNYINREHGSNFIFTEEELKEKALASVSPSSSDYDATYDEYFPDIARFVVENDNASINRVQKEYSIGFNRAQAIMEALESLGVVSENLGSRSREVLITIDELEDILADF